MCIFKVCYLENTFSLKSLSRGLNSVYGSIPCHWHCWVFIHMTCVFKFVYLKIRLHRNHSTGISRLQPASHLIRTVHTHSKILHSNHSAVTFRMWFHPLSSEDHNLIQGPLALTVKHSNLNFHKRSSTGKPLIPSKGMTYIWWWWDPHQKPDGF